MTISTVPQSAEKPLRAQGFALRSRLRRAPAMRVAGLSAAVALHLAQSASAQSQEPLSAIDWLRDSPRSAAVAADPLAGALPVTPPAPEGQNNAITAQRLDTVRSESVGLYPANRVGLPARIWGPATTTEIAGLFARLPEDALPALRDLTYRLLLAEFDAPQLPSSHIPSAEADEAAAASYVLARIDALFAIGALDQAAALLDTVESRDPRLVARRFEIGLLLGDDEDACADLTLTLTQRDNPADQTSTALAPARIFCQARGGDFEGAAEELEALNASGVHLPDQQSYLLHRFLTELPEDEIPLPLPVSSAAPSPLNWRILEALGESISSQTLPVAFAHADLRGTTGWRAQIEAVERLVRNGAVSPNSLLGLYTERRPAASGGIWERVRAVQQLDTALASGQREAIERSLLAAWPQIQAAELEVPFAALFSRPLLEAALTGRALETATLVGLLSEDYELAALAIPATASPRLRVLSAIARGSVTQVELAHANAVEASVLAAFAPRLTESAAPAASSDEEPPLAPVEPISAEVRARLAQGRMGGELLQLLARVGTASDPRRATEALYLLRELGLEDTARRTALQVLILERRG